MYELIHFCFRVFRLKDCSKGVACAVSVHAIMGSRRLLYLCILVSVCVIIILVSPLTSLDTTLHLITCGKSSFHFLTNGLQ